MMLFFLSLLSGILILWITMLYRAQYRQRESLRYSYSKLKNILERGTDEKLLLQTDDTNIKNFLIEINGLLEHNQKIIATHHKLERSMKKMISNISHDLKTPLTVVLGYTEIILESPDLTKQETEKLLQKVNAKTIEVLEMMQKFFELVRLEAGDKELIVTRVNMNEICRKNILGFYDILTQKGFEVVINLPDETIYAWGDEGALNRVLNNLLSNAIQYGGDGKTLGLTLRLEEKHVFADVWDKGKGISELHQDFVFERMYTLEDSRNKLYQGSGLGLTISKRLVEKMNGDLVLESSPGEKTVFTVKLNRFLY